MSDRVQDLTNHRKVATACKNYTDTQIAKSEEKLMWYIGERQTTTQDDNTTAYQKVVPANATRCKIKRIYGSTLKYNPSVASDTTATFMKTLPDTVYDLDVSKVYGASEVSENLLVLNNKAETTHIVSGITYKVENGIITLNGTATGSGRLTLTYNTIYLEKGQTYIAVWANNAFSNSVGITNYSSYFSNLTSGFNGKVLTGNSGNYNTIFIDIVENDVYSNLTIKPMLVKGSTAPTEFKVGYTGIHNLELSGLKVEGSNIAPLDNQEYSRTFTNQYEVKVIPFNQTINIEKGKTYSYSIKVKCTSSKIFNKIGLARNSSDAIGYSQKNAYTTIEQAYTTITYTFTATSEQIAYGIWLQNVSADSTFTFKEFILNYGSTALAYVPYITPTTKTIDLSTILYNGSPLFEGNSLKAVNDVKDSITPYKATKKIGLVDKTKIYWNSQSYNALALGDKIYGSNLIYYTQNNNIDTVRKDSANGIYIHFTTSYSSREELINAISDLIIYAELATPIEVSIDWSSTLRGIQGYSKGTIILQNTHNMDIDNTINYNSIIKEVLNTGVRLDGANLFDKDTYSLVNGNNLNDSGQAISDSANWYAITAYMPIKENTTYTLSGTKIGQQDWSTRICFYDENYNFINKVKSANITTSITFTTPSGTKYWSYSAAKIGGATDDWMLNIGSTALSYRPHKESITLNFPTQESDAYSVANVSNVRDFTTWKRGTNVAKDKLKDYTYSATYNVFLSQGKTYDYLVNQIHFMCSCYKEFKYNNSLGDFTSGNDLSITYTTKSNLLIKDDQFGTDTTTFKNHFTNDDVLYYLLPNENKTETDITAFNNIIEVEEGDILTFLNSENMDVPSDITYRIEVDRV